MKKTTTRTKEVWGACGCVDKVACLLCKGTGRFLAEMTTETIVEEVVEDEEIVEAEEVVTNEPRRYGITPIFGYTLKPTEIP
jgi:hypothetical protein